jgi:tRNA threonylcarbamoyladenosine biosynthesis protein TsaB
VRKKEFACDHSAAYNHASGRIMSNTTHEGDAGEGVRSPRGEERVSRDGSRVSDDGAPLTLCVDTATDARSVAVARGARVVALVREASAQGRTSALLEEIDGALREAGVALGRIDLYAVATGPGSFTGLRAGLATIKAFASINARPVAAVPTLHAVALSAGESARTLAMMPAGRGEVFAQTLRVERGGRIVELDRAAHVSPSSLLRQAAARTGPLKFAGGGARAHAELIRAVAAEAGIQLIGEVRAGAGSNDKGSVDVDQSAVSAGGESAGGDLIGRSSTGGGRAG